MTAIRPGNGSSYDGTAALNKYAIRRGVKNALLIATDKNYHSIAFPLIGAGTGGFPPNRVLAMMRNEAENNSYNGEIRIVQFKK